MPYSRNKLSVKAINSLPAGTHGDGAGLWLRKTEKGSASWIFRFRHHGKQYQMGLGSFPALSLASARKERDVWSEVVAEGKNPILVREIRKSELKSDLLNLTEIANDAYKVKANELKEGGKAGRWFSPLQIHVLPTIGHLPVSEINQKHIRDVLKPIWHEKADTARKAMNRLNIVMKHGAALGLDVDLQAVEKARALLGKQNAIRQHIPSMPWNEVSAFYKTLDENTVAKLALKFLILNPGPRSKPIRFLREEHISGGVWTIPGDLMKGNKGKEKDWRTPLSNESLRILEKLGPFARNGFYFPSARGSSVMSDVAMNKVMQQAGLEYRPHGFRASFKTWAAENGKSRDMTELCLAHSVFGAVEAAYLRTDFLEERRELMQDWSDFVCNSPNIAF